MTTTREIAIYQQTNTNGVLHLYCESCKPRGSKRGTLVVSGYDSYCAGCGNDFLEMAQDTTPEPQTPTVGTLVHVKGSLVKHVWLITHFYEDSHHFICELVGEPEIPEEYRLQAWNVDDVEVVTPEPDCIQEALQQAWEQLQNVPAYIARFARENVQVG